MAKTYKPKQAFAKIGKGPQRAKQIIKEAVKAKTIKDPRIGSGRWSEYDAVQIDKLVSTLGTNGDKAPKTVKTTKKASVARPVSRGAGLIVEVPASDRMLVEKFGWTILKSL